MRIRIRTAVSTALAAVAFLSGVAAEAGKKDKERQEKIEKLPHRYRKWLTEDAVYIISSYEREGFLSLTSDELRDRFIEEFWQTRDPTPGTSLNEFKVEHYKRIQIANRLFGRTAAKTGWKDERGKLLIQLGEPIHRESFPMSGRLYPVERWFYHSDPLSGLPTFFNILFFKPYGAGKFELYDPVIHGPEKLVGGILFGNDTNTINSDRRFALEKIGEVSPEVMQASMSLLPDDPFDRDQLIASMSSRRLMGRIEDFNNRQPFDESYVERLLSGEPEVEIEYSFRNMSMVGAFMGAFVPGGGTVLHYSVEVPPASLTLQRYDDRISGALEILGRVFTAAGDVAVTQIDEQIEIAMSNRELKRLQANPFAYQDTIPLLPGRYRIQLIVRNKVTREFGVVDGSVTVPERGPGPSLSSVMLSAQSRPLPDLRLRPFGIGDRIYHPVRAVPAGTEFLAFFQVGYPEGLYQVGERLTVRYYVARPDQDERLAEGSIRLRPNPVYEGHVTVGNLRVPLRDVGPGDYELRVELSDEQGRQSRRRTRFTVYPGEPPRPPWVYAEPGHLTPGRVAIAYADQYEVLGAEADVLAALERAQSHADVERQARLRLAEKRLARKEYELARAAVEPLADERSASTYTLLLLGLARSGSGDAEGAIAALERSLRNSPRSTQVMNLLAEEWLRSGDRDKAVTLLKRSLEADPTQPGLQALLKEAEAVVPAAAASPP